MRVFLNRWGVLIAVAYVALGGVLQALGINTLSVDATTHGATVAASLIALYGVVRKLISSFQKRHDA